MGSTYERNTRELTFALPSLNNYSYYLLIMLCCLASLVTSSIAELLEASAKTAQGCSPAERDALLAFKFSVHDPSNRLESWKSQHDCCGWSGVVCHNHTTTTRVHVVELNLSNADFFEEPDLLGEKLNPSLLGEKLSPSLLSLTHLESLDLGWNDFGGAQIPEFIGSFQKLQYLSLRQCNFSGTIPPQIGNLTSLSHLDLSDSFGALRVQSLDWLMRLSALTHLDMSYADLSVVSRSWFSTMNMLPSLQELRLFYCSLDQIPYSLSHLNLTSLVTLKLGHNNFNLTLPNLLWQLTALSHLSLYFNSFYGTIPAGIGNLSSLTELDLGACSLSGPLPDEFWSLMHLTKLDLSSNLIGGSIPVKIKNLTSLSELSLADCSLSGPLPDELWSLMHLTILDLTYNLIGGSIPVEIGNLTCLNTLFLGSNSLEGVISQLHFSNLTSLLALDLSDNSLLTIDHSWAMPFHLQFLNLNSLKLGPTFPLWLRPPNYIKQLSLSNTSIEGILPHWFWPSSSIIEAIDLSYNKINGTLPLSLETYTNLAILNLRSNLFEGPIPKFPINIQAVDLSFNFLSGSLPVEFPLSYYYLSYNQIHGRIPLSFCNSTKLNRLDLSHNQIYGEIPNCEWLELWYLVVVNLGYNNLSGKIPSFIGQLHNIKSLSLNNNNFYGQIPSSFQNCSKLQVLDISNNKLYGSISSWIGQSLQQLSVLKLRSNMFSGDIPQDIGQLSNLQIIDFANNNLSGLIPHSLGNLSIIISRSRTMDQDDFSNEVIARVVFLYESTNITISMKGNEYSFSSTLPLVKSIDLSNNYLDGEIPKELGSLEGLQTLNLSRNHLKGNIPSTIGGLKSLETLDLSYNILSGAIPQGLSALNSLNHLNLSYNNLSGMIRQGNQLQTLQDASIYIGNVYLCGALINKSCLFDKNVTIIDEGHEDLVKMPLYYLSITLGFLLGLWSVLVILLFKTDWRSSYFFKTDKIYAKAYVSIKIRLNL